MAFFPFLAQEYFGNSLEQYLIFLIIIAVSVIIGKIVYFTARSLGRKLTAKTKSELDDIILDVVEKPIAALIMLAGAFIGYQFLSFTPVVDAVFCNILNVAAITIIAFALVHGTDRLIKAFLSPIVSKTDSKLDDQLVPIISKLVKGIIIILALITIFSSFGYDLTAVLAGFGIGGLAFAFAAKETISDVFGGFSIFISRPFVVGDVINAAGVTGTVKEVGLRYTRIQDFDKRIIVVPNSNLASTIIKNISSEPVRRVVVELGLVYQTPAKKLEEAIEILKRIAKEHKGVQDECYARFMEFAPSSLNIKFIYYITDLPRKFDVISEVNFTIKRDFEKAGLDFAYPTQTVFVEK